MFYSEKLNKFSNIKHCFFSKNHGFSKGIYKSLNCGLGSNDKKENVLNNLNFVSKKIGVDKNNLILMHQTHSNKVVVIDKQNINNTKIVADALITKLNGVALGVLTADCVPIILYDEINQIISCVHAGWRGSLAGIIENTLKKFKQLNENNKITACIGPCIGNKSYEVGTDLYETFLKNSQLNKKFFSRKNTNKFHFDIRNYVNTKLLDLGISRIDNIDADTYKNSSQFFSYRRSQKLGEPDYGRCISTICLKT